MRAGAVTRTLIEAVAKPVRSPTSVRTGATVTPRDQSVKVGPFRSPVVCSGTVRTRLWPETTLAAWFGG
jgi:hypothetical protein